MLKNYIFIGNDKTISITNFVQDLLSAEILSEWKIEFILPFFSEKFPNQCKEQTNSKVHSNIFPLHMAVKSM